MQVPRIHVPYLLVVALLSIVQAVELLLPAQTGLEYVSLGILAAAGVTLLRWLHRLFKDGEGCLGAALPMTAVRVLVFAFLTCLVAPVWAAFAFMVLLRSAANAYVDRGAEIPSSHERVAREASGLVLTAMVLVLVEFVVVIQLDSAGVLTGEGAGLRVADVIGAPAATGFALFKLVCAAYWLWFVAKAVPPLYQAFGDAHQAVEGRAQDETL